MADARASLATGTLAVSVDKTDKIPGCREGITKSTYPRALSNSPVDSRPQASELPRCWSTLLSVNTANSVYNGSV